MQVLPLGIEEFKWKDRFVIGGLNAWPQHPGSGIGALVLRAVSNYNRLSSASRIAFRFFTTRISRIDLDVLTFDKIAIEGLDGLVGL